MARRGPTSGPAFVGALVALGLASAAACFRTAPPDGALRIEGLSMGTSYSVTVPGAEPGDEPPISAAVRDELELVDGLMSTYRSDSELSRFNRHRSLEPFALSPETFEVLAATRRASQLTGGAFDATVGPLVDAWGFGPAGATARPSDEVVDRLLGHCGWAKLRLDPAARTAKKADPRLQCDLSAIAKGYAVDRISAALGKLGFRDHLVEIGGELVARGRNSEGQAWRVGIERPDASGRLVQRILRIRDVAVATSGDYRNFQGSGGERYSHVLDPRTGRPVSSRVASATVLDASATRADALATALMVLGEDAGAALAEREDLAVLMIVREGDSGLRESASSRFHATIRRGRR